MNKHTIFQVFPKARLFGLLVGGTLMAAGCASNKPPVICAMKNPQTGAEVKMYKELSFKVPANYDEKKHIESWKAEQAAKGYTVEVRH